MKRSSPNVLSGFFSFKILKKIKCGSFYQKEKFESYLICDQVTYVHLVTNFFSFSFEKLIQIYIRVTVFMFFSNFITLVLKSRKFKFDKFIDGYLVWLNNQTNRDIKSSKRNELT
ncbi:hypothetical protein BpHYR1_015101 [Brachionus plicatilis]|uniref:Uncharacterized protein n=1 Tax=Brachionus plicatilis TaxID=10195 RepID=A0A3M7RN19_BRAPC|nr:hypothetical protein BpHYR1_015101 [Brachionus plicatilis]